MAKRIQPVSAPNLPMASDEYSRTYLDQLTNAMRLYFTQKDSNERALFGKLGGQFIANPYLFANGDSDQYAINDTPTTVKWSSAKYSSGFTLLPDLTASIAVEGVYRLHYELSFTNTDVNTHKVYVWLRVNGEDIEGSCKRFHSPFSGCMAASGTVTFAAKANDVFSLMWSTNQAASEDGTKGVYMQATTAQETPYFRPAIPAALGSITFLSAPQG